MIGSVAGGGALADRRADLLDDTVEKLASAHELHDEVDLVGGVEDVVQLDAVGVVDALQDLNLPLDLSFLLEAWILSDKCRIFFTEMPNQPPCLCFSSCRG